MSAALGSLTSRHWNASISVGTPMVICLTIKQLNPPLLYSTSELLVLNIYSLYWGDVL